MSEKINYDVIIIGAGIGGLTAGNILAKNGLKVLILEKNHCAGGAVSTFYRNGYPIDISHALCAVSRQAIVGKYLEYLGIYDKLEFIELERAFIYVKEDQKTAVSCYCNIDRYSQELSTFFPEETKNIEALFKEIVTIWKKEVLKTYYAPSIGQLLLYPFLFPHLFKYRNYTFEQYLDRFIKNPELKEVLSVGWPYLGLRKEQVSALYMICLIGAYHLEKSYFIKGGFGELIRSLVMNFDNLGGKLLYNTEVSNVLLKNKNMAYGIRDKNGNNYYAKKIISNIDSKKTVLDLIKDNQKVISSKLLSKVNSSSMSCTIIQVHLVAEAEIDKEWLSVGSIVLPINIDLENKLRDLLRFDNSSAFINGAVIMLSIHPLRNFLIDSKDNVYIFNIGYLPVEYNLWNKFLTKRNENEYKILKDQIKDLLIDEITRIWSIKKLIFSNILTPVSFEEWLNASEGAIYDIANSPQQTLFNRFKHRIDNIKNLYLVGAKTFPGSGIIGALISAFSVSDIILKNKITYKKLLV